jgi:fructose-bisphosphate aldolase class II
MALVSMRQLLDHAAENGYGLPAFNVNNLEQVKAIMEAADETNSPVIMQGSAGARKYAGGSLPAYPGGDASGSRGFAGGVHQCD